MVEMGPGAWLSGLMPDAYLSLDKEAFFPNLRRSEYRVMSNETSVYNCIAHAAGKDDNWWWPAEADGVHWPEGVEKTNPWKPLFTLMRPKASGLRTTGS